MPLPRRHEKDKVDYMRSSREEANAYHSGPQWKHQALVKWQKTGAGDSWDLSPYFGYNSKGKTGQSEQFRVGELE